MHKHIIALLPLLLIACANPSAPIEKSSEQSNTMGLPADAVALQTIDGDFDGDGTKEQATLYHVPEQYTLDNDSTPVKSEEERYIVAFNNKDIAPKISEQPLSHLTLIGDINGDGRDEYGLFTHNTNNSSWGNYSAYCNRDSEWQNIATTTLNINLLERIESDIEIEKLITADSTENGYAQIQHVVIIDGTKAQISSEKVALN